MRIRWRNLELPNRVTQSKENAKPNYGQFVAEPFERGFGSTIANSLRRILLSSLEGSAVTRVKIQGIQHEFSTIPGVVEDVTDICLNIKSLIVKNHSNSLKTLRIEKNTAGPVTGADVITDDQVDVINKDLVIANLTADVPFNVELTVENGRGFILAADHYDTLQEVAVIPLDAAFSPVTRVRYKIEDTRVGQRMNFDRLIMEIWTNGTVDPEMALVEAAKILRKHLNPFINYKEAGPVAASDNLFAKLGESPVDTELEKNLNMSLAELNLSVRATNCLESEGINTVRDLVRRTDEELLQVRNFGETTLLEVKEKLKEIGLRLGIGSGSAESARN